MHTTLIIEKKDSITTVTLNRPTVRNAFNQTLIAELTQAFSEIAKDTTTHIVFLKGNGPVFSAGADLDWMKQSATLSEAENIADAQKFSKMLETLNTIPQPLISLAHGAALGGGMGLVSVCDYVIASEETLFGFSEVQLGLIPAVISPFVISKIGESQCRALFTTGKRFKSNEALKINLIHEVVQNPEELQKRQILLAEELKKNAPQAMQAAKKLIFDLKEKNFPQQQELTAQALARIRTGKEAKEGVGAFLEKRKPAW